MNLYIRVYSRFEPILARVYAFVYSYIHIRYVYTVKVWNTKVQICFCSYIGIYVFSTHIYSRRFIFVCACFRCRCRCRSRCSCCCCCSAIAAILMLFLFLLSLLLCVQLLLLLALYYNHYYVCTPRYIP